MPDSTRKKRLYRLIILASVMREKKLLWIPKLYNDAAKAIAQAVHNALQEWQVEKSVLAMCFDIRA